MDYGDLGKRFVAAVIDGILIAMIDVVLILLLNLVGVIIAPIISWLYQILTEGGGWHATLGKRIMGLYVADCNGDGITYSTAILRLIGKMLSGLILCIGYVMALFNDQKQGLHDMIAKTYVLSGEPQGKYENFNANRNMNYNANCNEYDDNMPELVGINGPLAGMVYKIGDRGLVIGRDSISCQVVIPSSQGKVSRIHCYITFNSISGMFVLNDRNSTHGTYLSNGRQIPYAQPVALKSGDRFYLATPENTFEVR